MIDQSPRCGGGATTQAVDLIEEVTSGGDDVVIDEVDPHVFDRHQERAEVVDRGRVGGARRDPETVDAPGDIGIARALLRGHRARMQLSPHHRGQLIHRRHGWRGHVGHVRHRAGLGERARAAARAGEQVDGRARAVEHGAEQDRLDERGRQRAVGSGGGRQRSALGLGHHREAAARPA